MTDKPVADMSFEEAMGALEQVITALERGEVPLEALIAMSERGAALKNHCAAKLKEAEDKIEMIRAKDGQAVGTSPAEGM